MTRNKFLAVVLWQFVVAGLWAVAFLDSPFLILWGKCMGLFAVAIAPLVYLAWTADTRAAAAIQEAKEGV